MQKSDRDSQAYIQELMIEIMFWWHISTPDERREAIQILRRDKEPSATEAA